MKKVDLNDAVREPTAGHTSKGDQPKWQIGQKWYKADHMGYEALAEVVVSKLLEKSNVPDLVGYQPVLIGYQNQELRGCVSTNFRRKNESLIPLERLHRTYHGRGLAQTIGGMAEVADQIRYTVDFVGRVTGLTVVGPYLTTMLELDCFFLNEDRHTNNLAVIRNEESKEFRLCPIFDNGLALLSDLNDYPLDADVYQCMQRVRAKPFSQSFDEQVDAANQLYGSFLKLSFTKRDVSEVLGGLSGFYSPDIIQRVERILLEQMRRYRIYFEG